MTIKSDSKPKQKSKYVMLDWDKVQEKDLKAVLSMIYPNLQMTLETAEKAKLTHCIKP